jgi:hypothetical protein
LEAAGFPGPQAAGAAEAMAEAMSGAELATKADLLAVKAELQADLHGVKADALATKVELTREITATEARLSTAILKVANDLEIMRRDMTIRVGAIAFASTGIMIAAMRIMLAHP